MIILASIIVSLLSIVVVFYYYLRKGVKEHEEKIRKFPAEREFKTKNDFIQYFVRKGFSESSINIVYNKVYGFLRFKKAVLLPNDDLIKLYEIDEAEWFYLINKWFLELGRARLTEESFKEGLKGEAQISFEYIISLVDSKN